MSATEPSDLEARVRALAAKWNADGRGIETLHGKALLALLDEPEPLPPAASGDADDGVDRTCPECSQGKRINCTRDGDVGEEPCPTWSRYLDQTNGVAMSFPAWLTERGMA